MRRGESEGVGSGGGGGGGGPCLQIMPARMLQFVSRVDSVLLDPGVGNVTILSWTCSFRAARGETAELSAA